MDEDKHEKRGSKPGERRGGRQKGTPNGGGEGRKVTSARKEARKSKLARLQKMGFDPFEIARQIAMGEVQDTIVLPAKSKDGKPQAVKVDIPWKLRLDAAKELMNYMEPKRRAIEVTGADGEDLRTITRIERVIIDPKEERESE